ncbi:MAG: MATE family efflux transporter [Floccifex porci]|uniref:MATE family efflux transporter n=1 Tax=Floccifex porci TaxID=2606629 RepID=UPI0023F1784C|nr:MATE family efflux transporter [Floccifex porci]MDD7466362.1 MATE family efflux transporter [Floccifex porci]
MNKDLTIGNPSTVLWKFCLPLFGSVIFQQLYNIADSLIAGKFIGENALAAVGNSYEITLIFIAFAFGCNMGCSVITSMLYGEKNFERMKTAIYTSILFTVVVCGFLMMVGFLFSENLLNLIHTPDLIFMDSTVYLDIYMLGLPFLFFYNVSNGIFSALGDSKTPFYFLAFSSCSNILVDYLFVRYLKMGVAGVAWATFLCQGVSCILACWVVFDRLRKIKTKKVEWFSFSLLKRIVNIALPSTLQQSFVSVGNIIIQSIVNGFGASVIAGFSAATKLNNLVITSFTTIGNGISNYTAQNMGANEYKRVHEGYKAGVKMVWIICVPIVFLYFICSKQLIDLFLENPSMHVVNSGVSFLKIVSPFYFVISLKLVVDGILRGSSQMSDFMKSTFVDLLLRVLLSIIFSKMFGYIGIWMSWPVGWSVSTMLSNLFYHKWKKVRVEQ